MFSKKLISLFIGLLTVLNVISQQSTNIWLRSTLNVKCSSKFETDFELQHRRYNEGNFSESPLRYPLLTSFRIWNHYKINPSIKVFASPFAIFEHTIKNDFEKEIRFAIAGEYVKKTKWNSQFQLRSGFEFRVIDENDFLAFRIRNKFSFQQEITQKIQIATYYELLHQQQMKSELFLKNQERFGLQVQCKCNKAISMDLGYMLLLKNTMQSVVSENNWLLQIKYSLG